MADGAVLRGSDITDAKSMYDVVQPSTTIQLYVIKDETFVKAKSDYGVEGITSIPTVPGTMRIHQVMTDTPGKIAYRNVSCYCGDPQGNEMCRRSTLD